jgi:hypothetical protein
MLSVGPDAPCFSPSQNIRVIASYGNVHYRQLSPQGKIKGIATPNMPALTKIQEVFDLDGSRWNYQAGTQPTSPADGGPVFDAAERVLWLAQRPGSFGDIRDIRHNPWRAAQCFIGRARAGFPAFQGTNLHNRMSERGQSRLGGASCRSSHVRNAPLTTVGPKKAACRNGPQADIPNLSWVKVLDGPVRLTWNSVWPEQSFRRES